MSEQPREFVSIDDQTDRTGRVIARHRLGGMSEHERIGRLIEAIERETDGRGGWYITHSPPHRRVLGVRGTTLLAALTEAAERLGIEVAE